MKNEVEKPNQCDIQDKTLVEGGGETAELIDKAILGNDVDLLCELQQNTEEEVLCMQQEVRMHQHGLHTILF